MKLELYRGKLKKEAGVTDQQLEPKLTMNTTTSASPNAKDEMEFRLSLLKLMTVPHKGSTSVAPIAAASRQMEELSVLVPRSRKPDQRA